MKILITEQQYKLLSEGKDYVYGTYNGQTIEASNEDWEAIPFVYYNDKVYVGYTPDLGYEYKEDGYVDNNGENDYPNYHSEIMDFYKFVYRDDPNYKLELPQRRNTYEYLGRIWVESKIISFWKYPQDANVLKKILTLLAKEIKTIYDFDVDYEDYIVDINLEPENNNLISLKDYVKGNDATEDEMEQPHLLPSKEKRNTQQMQAVRDYDTQMKAEKFKDTPEYLWNYEKTKGLGENKKVNIIITEQQPKDINEVLSTSDTAKQMYRNFLNSNNQVSKVNKKLSKFPDYQYKTVSYFISNDVEYELKIAFAKQEDKYNVTDYPAIFGQVDSNINQIVIKLVIDSQYKRENPDELMLQLLLNPQVRALLYHETHHPITNKAFNNKIHDNTKNFYGPFIDVESTPENNDMKHLFYYLTKTEMNSVIPQLLVTPNEKIVNIFKKYDGLTFEQFKQEFETGFSGKTFNNKLYNKIKDRIKYFLRKYYKTLNAK